MAKALVLYANGSEDLEVTAILDVLHRGGVETVSAAVQPADAGSKIKLAHGTQIICDLNVHQVPLDNDFDLIAVPGGLPGSKACRNCEQVIALLKAQQQAKRWIGAICAAPSMVLADAGILGNTPASGYPGCSGEIKNYREAGVTIDKDAHIVTGRGPAFALPFALALLQELKGEAAAAQVAAGMLYRA